MRVYEKIGNDLAEANEGHMRKKNPETSVSRSYGTFRTCCGNANYTD